jgi:uncharacterized membrane protein
MSPKRKSIYITAAILSIYLMFTSGLVFFGMGGQTDKIDTPYAIALTKDDSIVGIYTKNDVECAKWIADNHGNEMIYADYNGIALLMDRIKLEYLIYGSLESYEPPYYVFLTEWNIENSKMVVGYSAALRTYGELPDLSNAVEVYRSSNAVVYTVGVASLTTSAATNVTNTTATLNGTVIFFNGGELS